MFGVRIFGIAYFCFESRSSVPFASVPSVKLSPPQSSLMLIFHERERNWSKRERERERERTTRRPSGNVNETRAPFAKGREDRSGRTFSALPSFLPEVVYPRGRASVWYFRSVAIAVYAGMERVLYPPTNGDSPTNISPTSTTCSALLLPWPFWQPIARVRVAWYVRSGRENNSMIQATNMHVVVQQKRTRTSQPVSGPRKSIHIM